MGTAYLKVFTVNALCQVPIKTLISLFTIKYCNSSVKLMLVKDDNSCKERSFLVDISTFEYEFISYSEMSEIASGCELPNLEENNDSCIAGLCATLRGFIKNVLVENPDHYCRELLGFKESCLLACSEASVWTRFCEIDITSMISSLIEQHKDVVLPVTIARFERHMSQPLRLHNLFKYTMSKKFAGNALTQDQATIPKDEFAGNALTQDQATIPKHEFAGNALTQDQATIPEHEFAGNALTQDRATIPKHKFAEGMTLSLADIIIFVCVHVFFHYIDMDQVDVFIPLTVKWYENLLTNEQIQRCLDFFCIEEFAITLLIRNHSLPAVKNQSLYKSDPKRYKPRNRIYTRQDDIDSSLDKVKSTKLKIELDKPFVDAVKFQWDNVPLEATPAGGHVPKSRLARKCHQLESLCNPVLKLAKDGDTIVDFCSGGGHLGILLAYLLPKCHIILLENKPESMNKAKLRVAKLSLSNVKFYQSNLDYFKGHFDIGTCLHACGVATDLVLQQCIDKNAAFVCCPCCYGSIQDCHRIVYPRSRVLKEHLDNRSYLVLGHAADQTHDAQNVKTKQGYECMTVIDTDRKMQAAEHGYQVYLNKLTPDTCSPKNHLLIGLPKATKLL